MRLFPDDRCACSVPSFRTYETEDIDAYIGYYAEATEGMLDVVPAESPDALERVLLKASAYRRNGHFLALEGAHIVADAVALTRTIRGRAVGLVTWNAVPDYRTVETFQALLGRCVTYLSQTTMDVRVLLRREHLAARRTLVDHGFTMAGFLARLSGPTSRSRSGRAVRTLRPDEAPTAANLLNRWQEENPVFSLLAIDGPFGTSLLRDASSGAAFAADRDDRAVGFIGVGVHETAGLVDFLAVEPDYRRSGVGSSLLSTGLFWLSQRDCGRAVTLVDPKDEAATEFFKRFSFEMADPEYRTEFRIPSGEEPSGA